MQVAHQPGMTVHDALVASGHDPEKSVAVIEGRGIPPDLAIGVPIEDLAELIVMPYVGGGGFIKTFAEIAVLVAAAAVSGGLGAGVLAGLGSGALGSAFAAVGLGGLSVGTAGLIGAGIALGGNLLINAFMGGAGGGGLDSATYDPTGPKTVASGGSPIPKGYGSPRWGGNIIASFVDAEGTDNYLNVLVCFGWAPALSLSSIEINNNSISNYKSVTYQTRLGANDQTPIPSFNNIKNGYPQEVRTTAGVPVVIQGTGLQTQGLEVVVQFPDGVYATNSDGTLHTLTLSYKVEYAVSGTGNWQIPVIPRTTADIVTQDATGRYFFPHWVVVPTDGNASSGVVYAIDGNQSATAHSVGEAWTGTQTVTYVNADGSTYSGPITLQGQWEICDYTLNQQSVSDWSGGYITFTDKNTAALYHTTKIYDLPPNKYDVRVTKYGSAFVGDTIEPREENSSNVGDQIWVHSINEVQYQALAYPNMILLGVRAMATSQLSGNGINITAIVEHDISVTLPPALAAYGHDNPAVVAYDMMTADPELYGGGIDPSQLSLADLTAWAAYNDQLVSDGFTGTIKRHVFNGVFEEKGASLWKSLQKVGLMSQCIPVQVGRNFNFMLDAPVTVPAQVFTVGNIKRDSIKDTWMSLDDRANCVEVTFADAGRNYRTDEPCSVMTADDIAAGVLVQNTRVSLLGCTSRPQAWHWAYRKLLCTKRLTLTRTFDTNIEGVACQIGSVIGIQDDVTQWSAGGRIQAGGGTFSVIVDRNDLGFAPSAGWTVSVLHPVVLRGTATIQTIVGNLLTFTGALPTANILRIVRANGSEATVTQYSSTTALLDSASLFVVGDVVSLYDEDVIDTQIVSSYSGFTITTAAPFLQAPTVDAPWVYGLSAGAFPAKLFRVLGIKRKGDFDFSIDTIIYDPSVYADDTPIITESLAVPDVQASVTGLLLNENYPLANGANAGQLSTVGVSWINGRDTKTTELWIAQNGVGQPISSETLLATVAKGTTYTFPAPTGAIIQIRAVGIDAKGTTASWNNAPIKTITIQGSGAAPGDITVITGQSGATGTALAWAPPTNAASYEVRYNNDLANTDWNAGSLLYAGTANVWADSVARYGRYLVKALTSADVESINTASYSYLESNSRLNLVGIPSGQTLSVYVTANSYSSSTGQATVAITAPQQPLNRNDGTVAETTASTLTWSNLAPATTYTVYTYLSTADFMLHSGAGDTAIPDTAANATHAAVCSQAGNYPGPVLTFTTPSATGSGGTTTSTPPSGGAYRPPSNPTGSQPNRPNGN